MPPGTEHQNHLTSEKESQPALIAPDAEHSATYSLVEEIEPESDQASGCN